MPVAKPKASKRAAASPSLVFGSLSEAARAAGMSRPTFVTHALPRIPHRRVGRRVLITRAALERWLEGHDAQEAA